MKTILSTLLIFFLLIGSSSCFVFVKENGKGKHIAWFRKSHTPHNPAHGNTGNPGNGSPKGGAHGKGGGKR